MVLKRPFLQFDLRFTRQVARLDQSRNFTIGSKGQSIVEAVLLLALIVFGLNISISALKQNDFLGKIVGGPWSYAQNMIEHGVWTKDAKIAEAQRPGARSKILSLNPKSN